MRHYLLLKFRPGEFTPEVTETIREILAPVRDDVPGIVSLTVSPNCVTDDENHDLMLEMDMTGVRALRGYRAHPAHAALVSYAAPKIAAKVTFDRE